MGLFDSFKKKSDNGKVVWRNVNGQIVCPGDACPKNCDDTCPIYLNTQCTMLMQLGANDKALELYKKAIEIAPDFYDAYNNMAGIYGGQGRYQEAYNCYLKAHELNKVRPNPVYGLALCCRDLNRIEECIHWCEEYCFLAIDNRLEDLYEEMKAKLGEEVEEEAEEEVEDETDCEIVREGEEWSIVKKENEYFFIDEDKEYATTPRGELLVTGYPELADRILEDLDAYGPDNFSADSILPWHYTLVENFSQMSHRQVEYVLTDSFIDHYDWTYTIDAKGTEWKNIWGIRGIREGEIKEWLSKITHMQMTAACCIGNAYHTINIAYMLAVIMETCDGDEREEKFNKLADFISENSEYHVNIDDFKTFEFYYGIHFKKEGNVIKDKNPRIRELLESISNNEKYENSVFWEDGIYFIILRDSIWEISDDASCSPRGGWFPDIVAGPTQEEKACVRNMMEEFGFDEYFFDDIMSYFDGEFSDEEALEYFEEEEDEASAKIYHEIKKKIESGETPFATTEDFVSAFDRLTLDNDLLYYKWEGQYIDLYENIWETGGRRGDYESMEDSLWIEILEEIDKHIVVR